MPYLAQRPMRIMGVDYTPGERVPANTIGARSLRGLLGRGFIVEVDPEDMTDDMPKSRKLARAGG